jgi:hypothetical protein
MSFSQIWVLIVVNARDGRARLKLGLWLRRWLRV